MDSRESPPALSALSFLDQIWCNRLLERGTCFGTFNFIHNHHIVRGTRRVHQCVAELLKRSPEIQVQNK